MARIATFRGRLAAIVAAGLLLRLVYVLVLARTVPSAGDSVFFHTVPILIDQGRGFVNPFVLAAYHIAVPTAAHPPLYPLVLAVPALVGIDSTLAQRAITCVIGAGVLVLIGLLGRRVAGERVGLASAGVAAVYPVLVSADGAPMSETLYGFMVVAALLAAFHQRERRDVRSALALGALIGLAALTRAEGLLLVPLLAWPLALRGPRRIARFAGTTLVCLAVLTPWTIRNVEAFHQVVVISDDDSSVLAGANCPGSYYGVNIGSWDFNCISKTVTLHEAAQANRWRSEGLDYARAHLSRLPLVLLVRLLRTWNFYQPHREVHVAEGRPPWAYDAGVAAYYVLLPLAVLGGLLLRRRDRGALWILLAPVGLVCISTLLGYGLPRFRHPAEPSIVVLASLAIAVLTAQIRRRRLPRTQGTAGPPISSVA